MVRHIDGNNFAGLLSGINQQNNASPVGYTSVTQGGLRILSEQGFYVGRDASAFVDGLLKVLGALQLTGTFSLSGIGTVTGPFTVEGNTSMTGNFTSTGEFTLTGPFHINGATDLNGIMTVHASGEIVIEGPVPLQIANGSITAGAAKITFIDGVGMVMTLGASTVAVGPLGTSISVADASAGISILGRFFSTVQAEFAEDVDVMKTLTVNEKIVGKDGVNLAYLPTKTGVVSNLWVDPVSGDLHQIV